ncbi:hypothetical protein MMC09_000810 [Bachmanniomyces sp. S44760]|nr:hypothetical protein [Bachmanniomyces sp. S44760]
MKGVASGAETPFLSILAVNVRTEIAFGMFADGCTAFSWKTDKTNFLAQNWDWHEEQKQNLIRLQVQRRGKPSIDMITEAGMIGKIGLNSAGVGVCLNALRAKGVSFERLPCHLALRACLDCSSADEALHVLEKAGVASACNILLADATGGVSLECSHSSIVEIPRSKQGTVTHTNHFLEKPSVVEEIIDPGLNDTQHRLRRIDELIEELGELNPMIEDVISLLKDEENSPSSICREQKGCSSTATLFSITMDLGRKYAHVKIGRPVENGEELVLRPPLDTVNEVQ